MAFLIMKNSAGAQTFVPSSLKQTYETLGYSIVGTMQSNLIKKRVQPAEVLQHEAHAQAQKELGTQVSIPLQDVSAVEEREEEKRPVESKPVSAWSPKELKTFADENNISIANLSVAKQRDKVNKFLQNK